METDMIKLGIIGCGNMGGAILRRALAGGLIRANEIAAADKNTALRDSLAKELGVHAAENAEAAKAPCVLLAVKPQFLPEVGRDIAPVIAKDALVLSIAAGYDLAMLHGLLGSAHIVRIMPNTPALVGEGVMAACRDENVTEEEWAFALRLLSCLGLAKEVPERLMDAVTGMSGSSPAFVFLFMEALADAGVRGGLPRETALNMAAQVMLGCGKLALETGKHPAQLKDMVTSPAGTTIEGVAVLEKRGFRGAVMEAVQAAIDKSKSFHK